MKGFLVLVLVLAAGPVFGEANYTGRVHAQKVTASTAPSVTPTWEVVAPTGSNPNSRTEFEFGILTHAGGNSEFFGSLDMRNSSITLTGSIGGILQPVYELGLGFSVIGPLSYTLDLSSNAVVEILHLDVDSLDLTMGETLARDGQRITIINVGAQVIDITDSAGVSELSGNITLGQYDSITLYYLNDRWIEVSRSDN